MMNWVSIEIVSLSSRILKAWAPFFLVLSVFSTASFAQSTVCATVKIEIVQELTIERQAFEATLAIENTLADKTLENVGVVVKFTDENDQPVLASSNPNDSSADFFIRVSSLEGINDVAGAGRLEGGAAALATWLIIPSPGSSGGVPSGKLYFVAADFNYTLDGQAQTITVAPDSIYVKPMPLLSLDYFLPRDVFADDPLTQNAVEPVEPFTLGVRVTNNGSGPARNLKIDSAQPEIVENEQGLQIEFRLLNSFVQDQPVTNSLLINFGDIPGNEAKMGRWNMSTTLSGRFTDFTADYSHADELGGELTSLIDDVTTHILLRDVLVDEPGRDFIRDFLADDLDEIRVYESNATTSVVNNLSTQAVFEQVAENTYELSFGAVSGFAFIEVPDPFGGFKEIRRVIREDGKDLNLNNVWFSKRYNRTTRNTTFHLNLFDSNTNGNYLIEVGDPIIAEQPPLIQFIPLQVTHEGKQLGFLIQASDPQGTVPMFSIDSLPMGAGFSDRGDGTAQIVWTPAIGQAGRYTLQLTASDGELVSTREIVIKVNPAGDVDGDGMLDEWELEQFGNLDRDGSGDADNDGISDIDEFLQGSDPNDANGPAAPRIIAPRDSTSVNTNLPELRIENGVSEGGLPIVYEFEVFDLTVLDSQDFSQPIDAFYAQPESESGETQWQVVVPLEEDSPYYWRTRATDGFTYSDWVSAQFLVNVENQLPPIPILRTPLNNSVVSTSRPPLVVSNVVDPDGDRLAYQFIIALDPGFQSIVSSSPYIIPNGSGLTTWRVSSPLESGRVYYWRAQVRDSRGTVSSLVYAFSTDIGTPPPPPPSAPSDVVMPPILQLLLEDDEPPES